MRNQDGYECVEEAMSGRAVAAGFKTLNKAAKSGAQRKTLAKMMRIARKGKVKGSITKNTKAINKLRDSRAGKAITKSMDAMSKQNQKATRTAVKRLTTGAKPGGSLSKVMNQL